MSLFDSRFMFFCVIIVCNGVMYDRLHHPHHVGLHVLRLADRSDVGLYSHTVKRICYNTSIFIVADLRPGLVAFTLICPPSPVAFSTSRVLPMKVLLERDC